MKFLTTVHTPMYDHNEKSTSVWSFLKTVLKSSEEIT